MKKSRPNFWGISLKTWIIIHILFELIENTEYGMNIINKWIPFWPGGKPESDSNINSLVGDNIFSILGWLSAYYLDKMGDRLDWYKMHL